MKAFLIAALLFLTSCASSPCENDDTVSIHREIARITSGITLLAPRGTNLMEAELLEEAARAHTEAFERDFGATIKPVRIYILRGFTIPCGTDYTRRYSGCYKPWNNRIFLIIGSRYHLPSLYHEYIHRMIPGHDVDHEDPRWEGEWGTRIEQIRGELLLKRQRLNVHKVRWGIK
jgi:hypothetical protein